MPCHVECFASLSSITEIGINWPACSDLCLITQTLYSLSGQIFDHTCLKLIKLNFPASKCLCVGLFCSDLSQVFTVSLGQALRDNVIKSL